MKTGKRVLALILGLALLLGVLMVPAGALVDPGYAVDVRPNILVHGIGQSEVFLFDKDTGEKVQNEDGSYVQGWPLKFDIDALLPPLLFPLIASLLLQMDIGLSSGIREAANILFENFKMDEFGMPLKNMQVIRYPKSMAETDEAGRRFVYNTLPLQAMEEIEGVGAENIYYFAYDSFGNIQSITTELYNMIQDIKKDTGCDKVNIVPISLGGTVMNSLLEMYPDVINDLHNVVYIIAALDGSRIVGDLFLGNLSVSNTELYRDMIPPLLDGDYLGYLLNIAIRLLPKRVVAKVLNAVIEGAVGDVISYATTMWALIPSGDYPAARERWLMDGEHDEIRKQTDAYYQAQLHSRANIKKMVNAGVNVYNIVDYDWRLYSIAGSYKDQNSDSIIHVDSTSMGATCANVGETLPGGYKQFDTSCGHNHLSPDGMIDASTGTLPETTFFVKGLNHERTGRSDIVMRLCIRLVTSADPVDVFSLPEFPQFNNTRDVRHMRDTLLRIAGEQLARTDLSPQDRAALQSAVDEAEKVLATTNVVPGVAEAAQARLEAALIKVGAITASEPDYLSLILTPICKFISDAVYRLYGPRGFSDWIFSIFWNIDLT